MLIILDSGKGQQGNQLLFLANVLSSAYQHSFKIKICYEYKYSNFILNEATIDNCIIFSGHTLKSRILTYAFKLSNRVLHRVPSKVLYYVNKDVLKNITEYVDISMFQNNNYYWIGWPYFDLDSVRNTVDKLRVYFSFSPTIVNRLKRYIESIKQSNLTIADHIRRGDYKIWREGKYYFSNSVYKSAMLQIAELFPEKICFIICSNENIPINEFLDESYDVQLSFAKIPDEDLCIMELCDYIIGPPSSFSGWASLIGNVPKYTLFNSRPQISLKEFKIWLIETDSFGYPL